MDLNWHQLRAFAKAHGIKCTTKENIMWWLEGEYVYASSPKTNRFMRCDIQEAKFLTGEGMEFLGAVRTKASIEAGLQQLTKAMVRWRSGMFNPLPRKR